MAWQEIYTVLILLHFVRCYGSSKITVRLDPAGETVHIACEMWPGNLDNLNKTLAEYKQMFSTRMIVGNCNSSEEVLQILAQFRLMDGTQDDVQKVPEVLDHHSLDKVPDLVNMELPGNHSVDKIQFNPNLTYLDLSGNNIRHIPETTFVKLKRLEYIVLTSNSLEKLGNVFVQNRLVYRISLEHNPHLELSDKIFANLPKLTIIDLDNCSLKSIPPNAFSNSTSIELLKLNDNLLETLPDLSDLSELRELELDNNRFKHIPKFPDVPLMMTLRMDSNLIREIPAGIFEKLSNIRGVHLAGNRINRVDPDAFLPNDQLLRLDLTGNDYQPEIPIKYLFRSCMYSLSELSLANNSIRFFTNLHPDKLINLEYLYLHLNFIKTITFYDSFMFRRRPLIIHFGWNNITNISFDRSEYAEQNREQGTDIRYNVTIYVNDNPFRCDCHNYDFATHFENRLKHYELLHIDREGVYCDGTRSIAKTRDLLNCTVEEIGGTCPEECRCFWKPHSKSLVYDCSFGNLTEIPELPVVQSIGDKFNQTEVYLEGNLLREGPKGPRTGWDNVTKADLSLNRIESFAWVPAGLKMLNLNNNSIKILSKNVLDKLENVTKLGLEWNPWSCDCSALDFVRFTRRHSMKNVTCASTKKQLMNLTELDLCFQPLYLILALAAITSITATLSALFYKYEEEILAWLWSNGIDFCCLEPEEELDRRKKFDAFISYAHQDADFVLDTLLPELESGPQPYKVCVHDRDWPAVGMIIEHIVRSVSDSRRTVVVLSTAFMTSVWGKMEFRAAHRQAMADRRTRIIVVVLGDFDLDAVDDEFRTYLRTNTYIKWKEPGDSWFWTKLKYSLPHPRRRRRNYCCRSGSAE